MILYSPLTPAGISLLINGKAVVYHQDEVLHIIRNQLRYIIIAKVEYSLRLTIYTLRVMICA